MATLIIRNVDDAVAAKLNELAKKNKISREEYLRRYLSNLSVIGEMKELEDKYSTLISKLAITINANTEVMSRVLDYLDEV